MKKVIKLTETDLTNIVKRVIKESEVKNYTKSILHLLDGFENEHVCGFKVDYREDDETYLIKIIVGNKDLDKDFLTNPSQRQYLNKVVREVNNYIFGYLPIRFLVDYQRTPNCSDYKKYSQLTESEVGNKNEAVRASMVDHLTRYLFEPTAKLIGSVEVFKKIFGDTPEEFLQSFNNLEKVLYKKDNPNFYFLFADNGAGVVMIQIYPSGYVSASIQPKIIIEPLHYVYKVSYPDIPKLIIPWLENSYGVLVDDLQTSKVTNREDI